MSDMDWMVSFRREDELTTQSLSQVKFSNIQGYVINNEMVGLEIVLKTVQEEVVLEMSVDVPSLLEDSYKHLLKAHILHLGTHVDVLDEYQSAVGIFLQKVIIRQNEKGGIEFWFFTLSDMGESSFYLVPGYVSVFYAVTHNIPIFAESHLLREKSVFDTILNVQKHLGSNMHITLNPLNIITKMITHEKDNEMFLSLLTDRELRNSLSLPELYELKNKVVEMEKFEWALRISNIIKEIEADEQ